MYGEKERPRQIRALNKKKLTYHIKERQIAMQKRIIFENVLRSQNCNLKDLMCDRCL